jgi:hypothetical protein
MTDAFDVTEYIQAKSNQLNADDLIGGPITVQIIEARKGDQKQPVVLRISGGHCPWKPCKTMMRLMVSAWETTNAKRWEGRWITLYRDGSVNAPDGTKNAGGIRVSAMSHIDRDKTFALTESRGKKKAWKVKQLRPPEARNQGAPTANLARVLEDEGLTEADVNRWLDSEGRRSLSEGTDDDRARLAAWLRGDPARIETIRSMAATAGEVPVTTTPPDEPTARDLLVEQITRMDQALPGDVASEVQRTVGLSLGTKPTDKRLSDGKLAEWRDALREAAAELGEK